jgi:hypothetical protein
VTAGATDLYSPTSSKNRFRVYSETHDISNDCEDVERAYRALVHEQHKFQRGRYHSMAIYSYDDPNYNSSPHKTYHNGRIAWETDSKVNVTTPATGITKRYLNLDNEVPAWHRLTRCSAIPVCLISSRALLFPWHSSADNNKVGQSFVSGFLTPMPHLILISPPGASILPVAMTGLVSSRKGG